MAVRHTLQELRSVLVHLLNFTFDFYRRFEICITFAIKGAISKRTLKSKLLQTTRDVLISFLQVFFNVDCEVTHVIVHFV